MGHWDGLYSLKWIFYRRAQELELRWQEYYELVTMLLQWIRHHIIVFEERTFPSSYEEIEVSLMIHGFNDHAFAYLHV